MTDTAPELDLTENHYTVIGLLHEAAEHNLELTIRTSDGLYTVGTPVQVGRGEGAVVTLKNSDEVWFVPVAQITRIAPESASVPIAVFTR